MKMTFTKHSLQSLLFWLLLFASFFFARAFFIGMHWHLVTKEPYQILDIAKAFFWGSRYDSCIAAWLSAPYFLVFSLFSSSSLARFCKRSYLLLVPLCVWGMLVADSFFFDYYADHFNSFFWEFWDDLTNTMQVMGGLNDDFPVGRAALAMSVGWLIILSLAWRIPDIKFKLNYGKKRPWLVPLFTLVIFALLARSTTERRPLSIQDKRRSISTHSFINLAHRSPFFSLLNSYYDLIETKVHTKFTNANLEEAEEHLKQLKDVVPDATIVLDPKAQVKVLQQEIAPTGLKILKRKPKHIVLLFLESYSYWVLHHPDQRFREQEAKELEKIKAQGIYFDNHFPSDNGTIKNIAAVNYGFPVPHKFHPAIMYHKGAFKNFNSKLPKLLKEQGILTRFFYAGNSQWHRLYNSIPRLGYDEFYAEHSFPNEVHHDYGLHDGGLYNGINALLKESKLPTFSFVMTQSNHPPYRVPREFEEEPIYIPDAVYDMVATEKDKFVERLRCFKYADHALGEFIRQAQKEEYFADTLFIITGDHPFFGISREEKEYITRSKIPLVFYAPGLIKDEYVGKVYTEYSHHIDLIPTLIGLLNSQPKTMTSWGRNLFDDKAKRRFDFNDHVDCLGAHCVVNDLLYKKTNLGGLERVTDESFNPILTKITQTQKEYAWSGLYYLYQFKE